MLALKAVRRSTAPISSAIETKRLRKTSRSPLVGGLFFIGRWLRFGGRRDLRRRAATRRLNGGGRQAGPFLAVAFFENVGVGFVISADPVIHVIHSRCFAEA